MCQAVRKGGVRAGTVMLILVAGLHAGAAPGLDRQWDFSDDMGAWRIQEGQWTVANGALVHHDPHFKGGLAGLPGVVLGDFRLEADVHITKVYWDKETVWVGFLSRAANPVANGGWSGGYGLILRANGEVVLAQTSGEGKELGKAKTRLRPQDGPVHLAIEGKGTHFRVYANGGLLFEGEDDVFATGEVALINFGNVATFDNVRLQGERVPVKKPEKRTPVLLTPKQHDPVTPLPRLAVRKEPGEPGTFYEKESGKPFFPRGFNHTVLEHYSTGWHATFN